MPSRVGQRFPSCWIVGGGCLTSGWAVVLRQRLRLRQAERLVRGSVWREHHGRVRGLHGRRVGDVRAAQRPRRSAQDYQQSPGQGLSAGLLHRRKRRAAARKALRAASLTNSIPFEKKTKHFCLISFSSFCVGIVADHERLRYGGCYFQEAGERPRLLRHRSEGGLSLLGPHLGTNKR